MKLRAITAIPLLVILVNAFCFGSIKAQNGLKKTGYSVALWTDWNNKRYTLTSKQANFLENCNQVLVSSMLDCQKSFGLTEEQVRQCMQKISERIIQPDMDHVQGIKGQVLADKIKNAVDEVIAKSVKNGLHFKVNENLDVFLKSQGFIEYVRTHVLFDRAMAEGRIPQAILQKYQIGVQGLLSDRNLHSVCGGYSWATSELAALAGYRCIFKVEGFWRGGRDTVTAETDNQAPWHSWNIICLPDGTVCYADNTVARIRLDTARSRKGMVASPDIMPLTKWEQGYFAATHFGTRVIDVVMSNGRQKWAPAGYFKDKRGLYECSFQTWRAWDTSIINPLIEFFGRDASSAECDSMKDVTSHQ